MLGLVVCAMACGDVKYCRKVVFCNIAIETIRLDAQYIVNYRIDIEVWPYDHISVAKGNNMAMYRLNNILQTIYVIILSNPNRKLNIYRRGIPLGQEGFWLLHSKPGYMLGYSPKHSRPRGKELQRQICQKSWQYFKKLFTILGFLLKSPPVA